ncbi:MAG: hypothetical protein ACI3XR_06120 [Eubacteriales bacterium]
MKNILRLSILTLLHALFFANIGYIFVIVLFAIAEIIPSDEIAVGCTILVCIAVPLFMGMIAVNNIKWWLISIPIQFVLDVGIRCAGIGAGFDEFSYIVLHATAFLACQAAGVGIRILFSRLKAKKQANRAAI